MPGDLEGLPKVTVNLEKCSGDAVCVDVCPIQVFEMQEAKGYKEKKSVPVNQDECIQCLACVTSCPTEAITVEED